MNSENQSIINETPGMLSKCGECKKQFYFVSQHKHIDYTDDDGDKWIEIIEIGCDCPHCRKWLHLGYFNDALLKRQAEIRNRRQERAFKRDYEKWQVEAREALGIAETQEAINNV